MNESKLREQICLLATSMFERGLTHGSTGNISVRLDDNNILVTPSVQFSPKACARVASLTTTKTCIITI